MFTHGKLSTLCAVHGCHLPLPLSGFLRYRTPLLLDPLLPPCFRTPNLLIYKVVPTHINMSSELHGRQNQTYLDSKCGIADNCGPYLGERTNQVSRRQGTQVYSQGHQVWWCQPQTVSDVRAWDSLPNTAPARGTCWRTEQPSFHIATTPVRHQTPATKQEERYL